MKKRNKYQLKRNAAIKSDDAVHCVVCFNSMINSIDAIKIMRDTMDDLLTIRSLSRAFLLTVKFSFLATNEFEKFDFVFNGTAVVSDFSACAQQWFGTDAADGMDVLGTLSLHYRL